MLGKNIVTMSLSMGLGALAYGQSFEFTAGAGATMSGNTILVSAASSFTIDVWTNLPTSISSSTALRLAVAFGDAQGTGTSAVPVNTFLSYQGWVWSSFSLQNYAFEQAPQVRAAAAAQSGNNYVTTNPSLLPIVAYGARSSQTTVAVPAGQTKLASLTFDVGAAPLLSSQNLYVAHNGGTNAATGSSGINPGFGSPIYRVQVVPEPATVLVLACGTLIFARRKRNAR